LGQVNAGLVCIILWKESIRTILHTPRLSVQALTEAQLQVCYADRQQFGAEFGIPVLESPFTPVVLRAIQSKLAKMRLVPTERHPWFTYWLIVHRELNLGIGLVGFKGAPNGPAKVEIGYGLAHEQQGHGFMTEAARALVSWALSQPECTGVTAWTTSDNVASHRVLEKVGFVQDGQHGDQWHWTIQSRL
jgi:[ribosomal protein S5]-alanine N-acetyltransferase